MKNLLLSCILIFGSQLALAQNFTLVTDASNPIVSEASNSVYYTFAYTGCAWVDVNHDDQLDLFYSGKLFMNQGEGIFRKYTGLGSQSGVASTTSCSWGDFNQDGHIDLLYSNNIKTSIYLNDGLGGLSITPSYLENIPTICWSAQFTDFNNDSWLDLTLTFADGFHSGHYPVRLLSGSDRGLYPISDTLEFLNDLHPYTVSYFTDYDLDGDQDLFIASGPGGQPGMDFHYNNLLMETGEAKFQKQITQPWAREKQDGQNYNFIDIDNDGDLDMCLTNWAGAPNRFYINNNGVYEPANTAFTTGGVCLSNAWGDFDNDSYIDVIITAGGSGQHAGYYRNNGNGTFDFKGNIILDNIKGNSAGCSIGDYDNDGDLDFFTVGMEKGLFRNDLPDHNNWINIALTGVESNSSAIGTKVRAKANIRGKEVWQIREISAQNTFMGHNSLRVHFGLSDATVVDSLIIQWPSGQTEVYTDLETKEFYKFTEGESTSTAINKVIIEDDPIRIYPNPARDYVTIELPQDKKSLKTIQLVDMSGKSVHEVQNTRQQLLELNLSNLSSGIYNIIIQSSNNISSKKLQIVK